jgi:hypothetical protein
MLVVQYMSKEQLQKAIATARKMIACEKIIVEKFKG